MTYDVQRWELVLVNASGSGYQTRQAANGQWVLAADAETHEKAAVQQAIRDCIAAVYNLEPETQFSGPYQMRRAAINALHVLLEGEK